MFVRARFWVFLDPLSREMYMWIYDCVCVHVYFCVCVCLLLYLPIWNVYVSSHNVLSFASESDGPSWDSYQPPFNTAYSPISDHRNLPLSVVYLFVGPILYYMKLWNCYTTAVWRDESKVKHTFLHHFFFLCVCITKLPVYIFSSYNLCNSTFFNSVYISSSSSFLINQCSLII